MNIFVCPDTPLYYPDTPFYYDTPPPLAVRHNRRTEGALTLVIWNKVSK